jgi:hypothetical protein
MQLGEILKSERIVNLYSKFHEKLPFENFYLPFGMARGLSV